MKNLIANVPADLKEINKSIIDRALDYHSNESLNNLYRLYSDLIEDEIMELGYAIKSLNIIEIYDAYCDIYWTCHIKNYLSYKLFGIYNNEATTLLNTILYMSERDILYKCLEEVLRSNYTKPKSYDSNGKVLKGKGYTPPDIAKVLKEFNMQ